MRKFLYIMVSAAQKITSIIILNLFLNFNRFLKTIYEYFAIKPKFSETKNIIFNHSIDVSRKISYETCKPTYAIVEKCLS